MNYVPRPIDTSGVILPPEVLELTEHLAENAHDVWARERMAQGWTYGRARNDDLRQHPSLIPYADLPESEKVHDRNTALQTLKAMVALGYRITKA
ncbi:MAG TPA: RyR domain-containing protein [Gemmataceae bacterium]|nr:RyR domain-containing protein [Gemmataceae bacterium]